jgi:hypothetical protein
MPFYTAAAVENEDKSAQMWRCAVSRARLFLGWKSRPAPGPRHRPNPARYFLAGLSGRLPMLGRVWDDHPIIIIYMFGHQQPCCFNRNHFYTISTQ